MSIDLMTGDLVRHARKGPGIVEDTAGYGDSQAVAVLFARHGVRLTVPSAELALFSEAEVEANDLLRLALIRQEREALTTFNALFREKKDFFVGRKGDRE